MFSLSINPKNTRNRVVTARFVTGLLRHPLLHPHKARISAVTALLRPCYAARRNNPGSLKSRGVTGRSYLERFSLLVDGYPAAENWGAKTIDGPLQSRDI